MKTLLNNLKILALLMTLSVATTSSAQDSKSKESEIKELLDAKNFVFKARSASSTGGGFRQLTSEYDLSLEGDTASSHLPYFGRAYSAPVGSTGGGIRFTSTDFEYRVGEKKNGRWNVLIQPKDVDNVREMLLSVSENGYASLRVLSNNRQPISFDGIVTEGRDRD